MVCVRFKKSDKIFGFMPFTKLFLLSYINLFAKLTNQCVEDAAVIFSVKPPHLVWRKEVLETDLYYSHMLKLISMILNLC